MRSKVAFILSMAIFGSIGILVRYLALPASEIAWVRGLLGSSFLFLVILVSRRRMQWRLIQANLGVLLLSSVALGGNWIFLFQAFKHTTIANAVLCYYLAPVFLVLLARIVLHEHITPGRMACVGGAMLGMVVLVGGQQQGAGGRPSFLGIACGLAAAGLYASLMILNKFIKQLTGLETTVIQLSLTTLVLAPYVWFVDGFRSFSLTGLPAGLLLILGIVHTGIGFFLFFSGMQGLKGQTIAALSYIDPLTALVLSALVFREQLSPAQCVGGSLILGCTFASELAGGRRQPAVPAPPDPQATVPPRIEPRIG